MKAPLLCALVLATATGVAQAEESSLSLYGVIDAGLINQRVTGPQGVRTSHTGMVSGGLTDTLFGVRGHEDLGGGLAAKFQFESMFNLARGETSDADHFFNNAAWVGLASENLGEIRLGRQHTAAQQFASQLEAASWVNMGMGSTFRASDNYQVKNAIGYLSPAWGGVSLGLTYSFDAAGDQIKGQSSPAVSAAVQYSQGPLLLVATWDRTRLTPALRPGASNPQAVQLGASYDFDVAKLSAAWSRQSHGYAGLNGGDPDDLGLGLGAADFARGGRLDAWLLGATVPVGAQGKVLAQWSLVQPDWNWGDGSRARNGQVATLGYVHSLSPRTTLYGMVGLATRYSLEDQVVQGQGTTRRVMVGLNHTF
ncbi:MAG TPA: porin [Ottowia sp.]|nr:porin [Ottowia sp.]